MNRKKLWPLEIHVIGWGDNPDDICLFSKGHHDKQEFWQVTTKSYWFEGQLHGPEFDVSCYGVDDIRYTYFRNEMMGDSKLQFYQEHYDGMGKRGCYPVTMIEVELRR